MYDIISPTPANDGTSQKDLDSRDSVPGSFSIHDGDGRKNVTFKMNSRFFKLCRVHSKCRRISRKSVSWGLLTLKFRKRKKNSSSLVYVLLNTSNSAFSRRGRAVKAKKCTKKAWCTCRVVVLLIGTYCFFDVLVPVAAVVCKAPYFFKQCDGFYYVPFQLKGKDEGNNFTGTMFSLQT